MKSISHSAAAILNFLNHRSSRSIIGFARTLLALGMLLTFVFNDINLLIPPHYLATVNHHTLKYQYNFFLLFNPSHLYITRLLAVPALLLIISGYYMQVTSILHFWITASFVLLRPVYAGGDNVYLLLTLLLIPVCLFDQRKNHWDDDVTSNTHAAYIQNIFLYIIKIQVAWIYFDSVFHKLHVKEWIDGTVIYYWFTHNFFGLGAPVSGIMQPLLLSLPVCAAIAWGTMLFEGIMTLGFLFNDRVKLILLKWGILFHFFILLIHGYASFFFSMSAALFLYLYPAKKSFKLNLF